MWEWFSRSFASDPAGWIGVFIAVAVILFSAVFWRTTWRVLKALGRGFRAVVRGVTSLRITTSRNLKPKPGTLSIPPRWSVTRFKDAPEHEFRLVNWGEGSTARNVKLHSDSRGVSFRSAAAWERIDGASSGRFLMLMADDAMFMGVRFNVEWLDEHGRHHWEEIRVGGGD